MPGRKPLGEERVKPASGRPMRTAHRRSHQLQSQLHGRGKDPAASGVEHEIVTYPDTPHGFFFEGRESYRACRSIMVALRWRRIRASVAPNPWRTFRHSRKCARPADRRRAIATGLPSAQVAAQAVHESGGSRALETKDTTVWPPDGSPLWVDSGLSTCDNCVYPLGRPRSRGGSLGRPRTISRSVKHSNDRRTRKATCRGSEECGRARGRCAPSCSRSDDDVAP